MQQKEAACPLWSLHSLCLWPALPFSALSLALVNYSRPLGITELLPGGSATAAVTAAAAAASQATVHSDYTGLTFSFPLLPQ